ADHWLAALIERGLHAKNSRGGIGMRKCSLLAWATLALESAVVFAGPATAPVTIVTSDVDRFYRVYDSANGHPTAAALQRDYINSGSDGVRQFVPDRIISGAAMAEEVERDKSLYEHARSCAA